MTMKIESLNLAITHRMVCTPKVSWVSGGCSGPLLGLFKLEFENVLK